MDSSICTALGKGSGEGRWVCTVRMFACDPKGLTLDSALSGSPDTLHTLPDGIGLNTTLQATCEPMGCHIVFVIIIIVIIHSNINYKYYHNIQTSFGLGV